MFNKIHPRAAWIGAEVYYRTLAITPDGMIAKFTGGWLAGAAARRLRCSHPPLAGGQIRASYVTSMDTGGRMGE